VLLEKLSYIGHNTIDRSDGTEGGDYMKKIILASALTAGLLVMPLQAVCASEVNETNVVSNLDISELKYEDIQKVIMEKSLKVRINTDTINSTENGYLSIQDSKDSLSNSISSLNRTIRNLKESETEPDADIASIETQISTLNSRVDSLEESLTSLENQEADVAKSLEKAKLSIEMANKVIVFQTESLFFTEDALLQQRQTLENNLTYLNKSYDVLKLRLTLGMVSELDLKDMEQKNKDLKNQTELISQRVDSIRGQVNILIAQDFNHPLNLITQVLVDEGKIKAMNYNNDFVTAMDKNYSLKLQQMVIEAKQLTIDHAEETDGQDSYVYKGALADLDAETLKFEEVQRETEQAFDTVSDTVHNNMEAYQLEKDRFDIFKIKLNNARLSNQLGLISDLDMLGVTVEYNNQELKLQNANEELFKAFTAYQWFLDGVNVS
ncbi:MAG: hypothetical protein WA125_05655, partial [Desulfosporosinus sp.]